MIIAKKSLGQNFLTDKNVIEKISSIINIEDKEVLEIGPGTGNLTYSLLEKKPKKIYAIEKDNHLFSLLQDKFKNNISLINKDILNVDENSLSNEKINSFWKFTL